MAGFRLLDRIHREGADRVGHAVVLGARGRAGAGKMGGLSEGCARRVKTVRDRHETGQAAPMLTRRSDGKSRRTDSMGTF